MAFEKELASGESLIALQNSESLRNFDGTIRILGNEKARPTLKPAEVSRRAWFPHRVIAIDGSNISKAVRNGFPGAEASLVQISAVIIDPKALMNLTSADIPRPRLFHEMEKAKTVDTVLPGANIVRKNVEGDSPKAYFRDAVYATISGSITPGHESLLETYRALAIDHVANIRCPIEGCKKDYFSGNGRYRCACGKENLLETDALRFHERFNEIGANGEVHGEVRHVLEVLTLINILRYFATPERAYYLRNCAFVLDGPLAVFGQPAWLVPHIRRELRRINDIARSINGEDIVLIGLEKTGQFMEHLESIDWSEKDGPRRRLPNCSVLLPDADYINRCIVFRPPDSKPHGQDTYFGRKVLYKTRSGEHAVINVAMLNEDSADFKNNSMRCFGRLGDVLDVMDCLSTYLYRDGFMPLVRAHAHAAIPLQRGGAILESLFAASPRQRV